MCHAVYSVAFYVDHGKLRKLLTPFQNLDVDAMMQNKHLVKGMCHRCVGTREPCLGAHRTPGTSCRFECETSFQKIHTASAETFWSPAEMAMPELEKEVCMVITYRSVGMDMFWKVLNDRLQPLLAGQV
jgi:hypothetical protein